MTTRFDSVFWMGDLNFRIEVYKGKRAVEDIVKYIEEQEHRNFEDLVSGDQLTKFIVEGKVEPLICLKFELKEKFQL